MDSDTLVEVLTTEHIQDMDNDEFLDCLSTLGSVSGWSDSQARTMFTVSQFKYSRIQGGGQCTLYLSTLVIQCILKVLKSTKYIFN